MATRQNKETSEKMAEMLRELDLRARRLLVFGGTTEGRKLAVELAMLGWKVSVCVATHTGAQQLQIGMPGLEVCCGRLDGPAMENLMESGFDVVIDATHPYAVEVSANVRNAAFDMRIPYVRVIRPSIDFSDCMTAHDTAEACSMVPADGGNVLATTGNKEIARYTAISGYADRVYARVLPDSESVESCVVVGIPREHVLAEQGPFSKEHNIQEMREFDIRYMITKESGATGGFAEKLDAARECGVKVIVVERPQDEDGVLPDELVRMLSACRRGSEA